MGRENESKPNKCCQRSNQKRIEAKRSPVKGGKGKNVQKVARQTAAQPLCLTAETRMRNAKPMRPFYMAPRKFDFRPRSDWSIQREPYCACLMRIWMVPNRICNALRSHYCENDNKKKTKMWPILVVLSL